MTEKRMACVMLLEAMACITFCFLKINGSGFFSSAAAFPFEQIGLGLRILSLSGAVGNGIAVLLYALISLIPCFFWLWLKKIHKIRKIDLLLVGLSILLFIVFYYMINPGLFFTGVPGIGKWMLGCMFYSVFFGYLTIRMLIIYTHADEGKLQKGLYLLLWILNFVFIYMIFGRLLGEFLKNINNIQGSKITCVFIGFHYLVNILPYLFDIGIIFLAIHMLKTLEISWYSDEAVREVNRLADFGVKALEITVSVEVIFNLAQIWFCNQLLQVDIVITIPFFSIIFVFAVLLFARYVQENQRLKMDNDLFI